MIFLGNYFWNLEIPVFIFYVFITDIHLTNIWCVNWRFSIWRCKRTLLNPLHVDGSGTTSLGHTVCFNNLFFFFQHIFQKIGNLLLETPILFLLMTRILMLCIWVSFLKEDGLFMVVLVIFLSSLFVLKTYDMNESFGTKVLAVYTALFTPCIPLQQTSRFHLYNSLLSQCEEDSNKTGLWDILG